MPVWQFNERHTTHIAAPPERVFTATRVVTADEIPLFQLLTWIRRGGRPGPESILNASGRRPLLEVATSSGFIALADDSPRELVLGTLVMTPAPVRAAGPLEPRIFLSETPPGVALAAMNFLVIPDGAGGSLLSTETRVHAGDSSAAQRFAVYWRLIRPGSDMIRRMWLRAIKLRAERAR